MKLLARAQSCRNSALFLDGTPVNSGDAPLQPQNNNYWIDQIEALGRIRRTPLPLSICKWPAGRGAATAQFMSRFGDNISFPGAYLSPMHEQTVFPASLVPVFKIVENLPGCGVGACALVFDPVHSRPGNANEVGQIRLREEGSPAQGPESSGNGAFIIWARIHLRSPLRIVRLMRVNRKPAAVRAQLPAQPLIHSPR